MEKGFHPISGEPVFMATEREKEIIDVALLILATVFTTSSESGVRNG